ncbi:hypothetical protein CFC21_047996, partial [Triticum aestivum]
TDTT